MTTKRKIGPKPKPGQRRFFVVSAMTNEFCTHDFSDAESAERWSLLAEQDHACRIARRVAEVELRVVRCWVPRRRK